jgi:hypothetical protein
MILDVESIFTVGEETFVDSYSPTSSFGVIFEDDLDTGYFYAIDANADQKILDGLHVYNVADVSDRDKPCTIQIVWTDNGNLASLLINNYCHAIFDFKKREGYCRNAFPPAGGAWQSAVNNRKLTDELIPVLFENEK